jgi:hypothetical protein
VSGGGRRHHFTENLVVHRAKLGADSLHQVDLHSTLSHHDTSNSLASSAAALRAPGPHVEPSLVHKNQMSRWRQVCQPPSELLSASSVLGAVACSWNVGITTEAFQGDELPLQASADGCLTDLQSIVAVTKPPGHLLQRQQWIFLQASHQALNVILPQFGHSSSTPLTPISTSCRLISALNGASGVDVDPQPPGNVSGPFSSLQGIEHQLVLLITDFCVCASPLSYAIALSIRNSLEALLAVRIFGTKVGSHSSAVHLLLLHS